MIDLKVNGETHHVDVEPETPLLWVLRDKIGLTAPKYGGRIGQCGFCTVHLDGSPTRSCVVAAPSVDGTFDFRAVPQRGIDVNSVVIVRWEAGQDTWVGASKYGGHPL